MDAEVEARIRQIEVFLEENNNATLESESVLYAVRDAVISLLAQARGISLEQAGKDFENNRRARHQALLEQMERISPNLAARADRRKIDDVL